MKAFELYSVWESFKRLMDDPAFDAQMKREMGVEMINSLPPSMLCTVSKSSREAIELAMKGRLTDIGNNYGRSTSKEEESASPSKAEAVAERDKGSRKKPLRKDAAN